MGTRTGLIAFFPSAATAVQAAACDALPVNVDTAPPSAGISSEWSRCDHKHDAATAVPVSIGLVNAEGVSLELARADHVHALGESSGSSSVVADVSTANTLAFTTIPGDGPAGELRVDIVTVAGDVLLADFTASAINAGVVTTDFYRLTVDGLLVLRSGRGVRLSVLAEPEAIAISTRISGLAAGLHSVRVQWKAGVGVLSAATIRAATMPESENGVLVVRKKLA